MGAIMDEIMGAPAGIGVMPSIGFPA